MIRKRRGQKKIKSSLEEVPKIPKKPEKRNKKVRFFYVGVVLTTLIVVLLYAYSVFLVEMEQKHIEEEKASLLAEKSKLEEELRHVTDPAYIEQQARTELRMIKPGEILYVLPDKGKKETNEE